MPPWQYGARRDPFARAPRTLSLVARVATVTLDRPRSRNALNRALRRSVGLAIEWAESSVDVDVVVLTGTDPAFCAGLDTRELGTERTAADLADVMRYPRGPLPPRAKPLIGAINGPAVTGGLELALHCDILIASERANFADTHARVGLQPGWGLTVLLPQAIGLRRAKAMSSTSEPIDAPTALSWGLVTQVVGHDDLLPTASGLAEAIIEADQEAVRRLLGTYDESSLGASDEVWGLERRVFNEWLGSPVHGMRPAMGAQLPPRRRA